MTLYTILGFYFAVASIVFFILSSDDYYDTIEYYLNSSLDSLQGEDTELFEKYLGRNFLHIFIILIFSIAWPITLPFNKIEK